MDTDYKTPLDLYLRDHFKRDLKEAAHLLKNGSLQDLADFASRDAKTRAKIAWQRALSNMAQKGKAQKNE